MATADKNAYQSYTNKTQCQTRFEIDDHLNIFLVIRSIELNFIETFTINLIRRKIYH